MIDLYMPFTETSSAEYTNAIASFIRNINIFNNIPLSNVDITSSSVTFHLNEFGLENVYIAFNVNTGSYNGHLKIATQFGDLLGNNSETSPSICKVLTVRTNDSSAFWLYTPTYGTIIKFILTDAIDVITNTHKTIFIVAKQNLSTVTTCECRVYYDQYYSNLITNTGKFASGDFDNFVIDNIRHDRYVFTDLYNISGGNSNTTLSEVMEFNDVQYVQLANHIYLKAT